MKFVILRSNQKKPYKPDSTSAPKKKPLNKSYKNLIQSQPILDMINLIAQTEQKEFNAKGLWESCLCALIYKKAPDYEINKIIQALPEDNGEIEENYILTTMTNLGFTPTPAKCHLKKIEENLLPVLFIPPNGVPSIILQKDKQGAPRFYDPISKLISAVPPSFDKTGKIWSFTSSSEHNTITPKSSLTSKLLLWIRSIKQ